MEHTCSECGARMIRYWHKLTPGLVATLVKVYTRVAEKQENMIHKSELDLDHSEYGNFQKLRFHALIAKYKPEGVWKHGSWVITKRGADFLKGMVEIPDRVRTYRNKVEAHSDTLVNVTRVMAGNPYWEEHSDFVNQESTLAFLNEPEEQTEKLMVIKPTKKKKGKKYCPKCDVQLKIAYEEELDGGGAEVKVKKVLICPICKFKMV